MKVFDASSGFVSLLSFYNEDAFWMVMQGANQKDMFVTMSCVSVSF